MPARGTIVVDENLCKACELCIEACPQHVIALDMEIRSEEHTSELQSHC